MAVEEAKEEGFPTDVEEKEAYFMQEVARGEGLSGEGMQQLCDGSMQLTFSRNGQR